MLPTSGLSRALKLGGAAARAATRLATTGALPAADGLVHTLGDLRGLGAKVGQMASYLEGMSPSPEVADAFARLRQATTTSPFDEVRAVIERELEQPLDALFRDVDPTPLASASLAQVHRATRHDGRVVAIKVLHPGIHEAVDADLRQVDRVAGVAGAVIRGMPVDALIEEVRERLLDELDLRLEAWNQETYALAFDDDPDVRVPEVHPDLSAASVLTSDLVTGATLDDAAGWPGPDRDRLATSLWRLFIEGALATRLLHGDPHPGNLLPQPGGGLIALDFGCVQPLRPPDALQLRQLLRAGLTSDAAIADELRHLQGEGALTEAFIPAWQALTLPLRSRAARFDRPRAREVMARIQAAKDPRLVLRDTGLHMPPWWVLAHRTLIGLVSVLARLDANPDLAEATARAMARQPVRADDGNVTIV